MKPILTLDMLKALTAELRAKAPTPATIHTQAEADEMTRTDVAGYRWSVGESYYVFPVLGSEGA